MQLQSFLFLLVDVNIAALGLLQDCLKAIESHQAVSVNIQKNQAMIPENQVVYKLLKMKLKRWITSGRSVANLRLCHEPLHHLPMLFHLNQFSCIVRLCHLHHHHCPHCPQSMIFSWKHRGRLCLLIIRYCHNNLLLLLL